MAGKIYVKELKMIRDKRKNAMKIFSCSSPSMAKHGNFGNQIKVENSRFCNIYQQLLLPKFKVAGGGDISFLVPNRAGIRDRNRTRTAEVEESYGI